MTRFFIVALACLAAPAFAEPAPAASAAPAIAGPAVRSERLAESDGTLTLVHEAVVDAPPAGVWQVISTVEGWKTWAVPVAWSDPSDPDVFETSYDPAAQPGQPQTIRQRVLARIPGRMMAFRTIKAPAGFADFDHFKNTLSVIELAPEGEGKTRVRLTGVGYPDTEAGHRLLGFFEQGNAATLEMLRRRFAEGPMDWAKELAKLTKGR